MHQPASTGTHRIRHGLEPTEHRPDLLNTEILSLLKRERDHDFVNVSDRSPALSVPECFITVSERFRSFYERFVTFLDVLPVFK